MNIRQCGARNRELGPSRKHDRHGAIMPGVDDFVHRVGLSNPPINTPSSRAGSAPNKSPNATTPDPQTTGTPKKNANVDTAPPPDSTGPKNTKSAARRSSRKPFGLPDLS